MEKQENIKEEEKKKKKKKKEKKGRLEVGDI